MFLNFILIAFVIGGPLALIFLWSKVADLRRRMSEVEAEMIRLKRETRAESAQQAAEIFQGISEKVPWAEAPPTKVEPFERPPIIDVPSPERAFARPNWEQFLGVKLFAWIGGLTLFMGVSFFLKYSFERDLIPAWMRVVMGLVFGVGLIAGGGFVRRRHYLVTAQTLVATGLVVLYAVSFVARSLYHLINTPTLFLAMSGITIAALVLAVRMDAKVVSILGVLGGFLTPVLVGGAKPNPFVLFGYVAVLNVGLFAIGRRQGWGVLLPLGAGATIITEISWTIGVLSSTNALGTMLMLAALNAFFLIVFFLDAEPEGEKIIPPMAHALAAFFVGFGVLSLECSVPSALVFFAAFLGNIALVALLVRSLSQVALGFGCIGSAILLAIWISQAGRATPLLWLFTACVFHCILNTALPLWLAHKRNAAVFPSQPSIPVAVPYLLLTFLIGWASTASPTIVFVFLAVLTILTFVIAVRTRDYMLMVVALGGTLSSEFCWHAFRFNDENPAWSGVWYLAFFLSFTVAPFIARRWLTPGEFLPWRVSAVAGPLHFFLLYQAAKRLAPDFQYPGLVPAFLSIPAFIALAALRRGSSGEERMRFTAIYGASLIFFLTMIFPIQFRREWLTIGWALEGAALLWLYRRVAVAWLPKLATALLLIAFARFALNPYVLEYYQRGGAPILNWYLYAYGTVAAALFVAARFASTVRLFGVHLRAAFSACGVMLLFLLMNIEIADFFATGPFLVFEFSGNFARSMTYSLAWASFALILLAHGAVRDFRPVRIAGMALMVATLVKLFFHDLSQLDQLYRIGAFIGVAIILIFASWLYQKFLVRAKTEPQG